MLGVRGRSHRDPRPPRRVDGDQKNRQMPPLPPRRLRPGSALHRPRRRRLIIPSPCPPAVHGLRPRPRDLGRRLLREQALVGAVDLARCAPLARRRAAFEQGRTPHPLLDRADSGPLAAFSSLRSVGTAGRPEPAFLTSFLLRPAMHRTQRSFLASGCSTYCQVRLRAPRVENTAGHGTSLPSRRKLIRNAGFPPSLQSEKRSQRPKLVAIAKPPLRCGFAGRGSVL